MSADFSMKASIRRFGRRKQACGRRLSRTTIRVPNATFCADSHYQIKQPQGKLVRVIAGEVFDVAVDIRKSSPTFGRWVGFTLSAENKRIMWIPEGFAHGFLVLSDFAEFLYKTTDYWAPEYERTIIWNDTDLSIEWPLQRGPIISAKDSEGVSFRNAECL